MTQEEFDAAVEAKANEVVIARLPAALDKAMENERFKTKFLGGGPGVHLKADTVPVDITATRYIKALTVAKLDGLKPFDVAKAMYPKDALLMDSYEKALSATILSDGGATVPEILSSELILPLYTRIGATKLGSRRLPMTNGNMTIPRINTAATVGWVGENKAIPKSQEVLGDVKLNAKKLGVLVPISNDLLRSSTMAADQWVLKDVQNQMYVEMDRSMLYGSNTQYQPGGLSTLLSAGQKQGSSSTAFTTTLITTLYGQLGQANVNMIQPGILMNASTESYLLNLTTSTGAFLFYAEMMERGTIRGIPYAVSNNCAFTDSSTDYVDFFIGDWSEFLIGEQLPLSVEVSREASYLVNGTSVSAFERDQTLIRVIALMDYQIRHDASFIQYTAKLATS